MRRFLPCVVSLILAGCACGGVDVEHSDVSLSKGTAVADGVDAIEVTVSARSTADQPVANVAVTLALTGEATLGATSGTTGKDGDFRTTLTSTHAGTVKLVAHVDDRELARKPTVTFVAGPAAKLLFATTPSTARAGQPLSAVSVDLVDAHGNRALTSTAAISLSAEAGTLHGGEARAALQGRATFDALTFDAPQEAAVLRASSPGVTDALSAPFPVLPGPVARMRFEVQPADVTAGVALLPAPVVRLEDALGNLATDATDEVSLTLRAPSGATLRGTTQLTPSGGRAVFTGLHVDVAGVDNVLVAAVASLSSPLESEPFDVSAAEAHSLLISATPPTAVADGVSPIELRATVQDAFGNPLPAQPVSFSVSGTGHVLSQVSTTTARLTSTKAEPKTVRATADGLEGTTSVTFTPGALDAAHCALTATPGTGVADGTTAVSLTFTARDAHDNAVSGASVTFSVTGSANTLGATSGTTGADGTFTTTLTTTRAEPKHVTATSGAATREVDVVFGPGAPSSAASLFTATGSPAPADGAAAITLSLSLRDAHGNRIGNAAVALSASGTGHTFTPASGTTASDGAFTSALTSTRAEAKTVTVTSGAFAMQAPVVFTAGAASATHSTLGVTGSPAVADGVQALTLTFTARDAFDNAVPAVAVSLAVSGTSNTLAASSGSTDAQGRFVTTLTSTRAESKTITATFGASSLQATGVFVAGAATQAQSTFTAPTTLVAGVSGTVTVLARDAFSNPVSGVAVSLSATGTGHTFGLASGTTGATGELSTTFTSTVAEAKTLSAQLDGRFTLTRSLSVTPGAPATTSTLVAAPTSVVADGTSRSTLTVTVRDAFSNVIPSATVTLAADGEATLVQPPPTDAAGVTSGSISSSAPGVRIVSASVGATTIATTPVTFTAPVSPTLSSVSVAPAVVPADGVSLATVSVVVRDTLGAVMPGAAVAVSYSGSATPAPASATTNASGLATFTLLSSAPTSGVLTAVANGRTLTTRPALDFRAVYAVSGVVTGLSTSGLVLASPGLADLPVPSGATTFSFTGLLPSGALFDVSIRTQPTGQRCEVRAARGYLVGASSNVAVRCEWPWTKVSSGDDFTLALRSDGSLWSFGANATGQLGLGDTRPRAVPTLIGTGFTDFSTGAAHVLALKSDGTLVVWGDNADGQLGLGDGSPRTAPTSIGTGYTRIAAGGRHSLALRSDGTVWGWGRNDVGQLGLGETLPHASPAQLTALGQGVASLAAGAEHSFALFTSGALYAWGNNGSGRLGVGDTAQRTSPTLVGTGYARVVAGEQHSLGLDTMGGLRAWGRNDDGQLGLISGAQLTPVLVGSDYATISAAGNHSAGVTTGGALRVWGRNESGQLGLKDTSSRSTPTALTSDVATVAAGAAHLAFLRTDGTLWTQGANAGGQLGLGDRRARWFPARVGGFVTLASGVYFSLALEADGSLWGWGNNPGTLGLGDTSQRPAPTLLGTGYVALAGGQDHTLALRSDGTLWSFGQNGSGQLGVGDLAARLTPTLVGSGYAAVAAGEAHSLALRTDGTLWAWGRNDEGELGLNDTAGRTTPTQVTGAYTAIAAGLRHSLALRSDGSLWAWGDNRFGQLGLGDATQRNLPVQVGTGYRELFAGGFHSLALRTDGTLVAWGANDQGQVGTGGFGNVFTPQPVGTGYVAVGTNRGSSQALKSDGTLWSWGENSEGQLGSALIENQPLPVQSFTDVSLVASGSGLHTVVVRADGSLWTSGYGEWGQLGRPNRVPVPGVRGPRFAKVAASQLHSLGVTSDGVLWSWGDNGSGQLGVGDRLRRATPVQVGTGYSAAEAGSFFSVALKSDGTLWSWGRNTNGQLGVGDQLTRLAPVLVGAGYTAVCAGYEHALALKADHSLWSWGLNASGQLGLGDTTMRTAPTQVGTGYVGVACGDFHTLALQSDGTLWSWGLNNQGQLGLGDTSDRSTPTLVGSGYGSLAAATLSVALKTDGTLWWFGLGAGTSPVQLGTQTWVAVSAGNSSALALRADGSLWSWGYNGYGQLGLGDPGPRTTPTLVGHGYASMSMGASYALALEADGSLRAWGYDGYGQLGTAEVGQNFPFTRVP